MFWIWSSVSCFGDYHCSDLNAVLLQDIFFWVFKHISCQVVKSSVSAEVRSFSRKNSTSKLGSRPGVSSIRWKALAGSLLRILTNQNAGPTAPTTQESRAKTIRLLKPTNQEPARRISRRRLIHWNLRQAEGSFGTTFCHGGQWWCCHQNFWKMKLWEGHHVCIIHVSILSIEGAWIKRASMPLSTHWNWSWTTTPGW